MPGFYTDLELLEAMRNFTANSIYAGSGAIDYWQSWELVDRCGGRLIYRFPWLV